MKKILILCFVVIIFTFESCARNDKLKTNNSELVSEIINTTDKNEQGLSDIPYNDGTGIQNVYISYLSSETSAVYDEKASELLNNIKNCRDVPETSLKKMGEINVTYNSDSDLSLYAELYIGQDGEMYAKFIADTQNDYAYKIVSK